MKEGKVSEGLGKGEGKVPGKGAGGINIKSLRHLDYLDYGTLIRHLDLAP